MIFRAWATIGCLVVVCMTIFFIKKKCFSVKDGCVVHTLLIKIIDYMDIFIIVWQVNLSMSIMKMWPFCSDHGPLQ